ncbi:MAG: InlB B-repeat-containing protein, partial [Acholeplasmataceae bacterium]
MKKTILVLTSLLLLVLLTSCNIDIFNQNKIYEITFNANGGQTINHIYVNDSFTEDDLDYYITTKEGFVFDGWYIDQTFEHTLGDDINSPVILYAKWLEIFTITWINENDNILSTTEVIEGEMPVYDGQIPTKAYDGSYTYEFSTWSPVITEVYEDMTYTATYTATYDVTLFDTNEIDDIFNFDFSTYIPSLNTQDYEVIDESDETDYLVSIHIFDWVDTDYVEYENELNQLFYFDEDLFYWMNGNFKIYLSKNDIENEIQITLSGSKEEDVSTWIELMQALNNVFDIDDFITLLPTMQSLTHIGLLENLSGAHVSAFSDTYNTQSAIDTYEANLLNQGWYFNQVLSDTTNENVYVYQLSESNSIAIYLNYSDDQVYFNLWTFDQSTSADELDTFVNQKSITVYEETKFNKSGLPSEGTYDVLVIPVEIKGNPFPSNYLLNLEIAFNGTPETTGWQSVSSFYETSSFGKLNLSFDIHTKYITDYSASYYESFADTEGDQYAMVEAINGLDSSIDYSQYD